MAEKEEEVKEIEMREVKKRKVSLTVVSYNNTDVVFNRFKMFK